MRIASSGDISIQKTTGSVFNLRRDDTSVVAGDGLGSIFFQGNDPSNPYKSGAAILAQGDGTCLLYTSPSPRDRQKSRMPSSA